MMKRIITKVGPCTLRKHHDYFVLLCQAIIAQQISNAAAASITKRFKALYNKPTPAAVLRSSDDELRSAGVSPQKQRYLRSLAQHFTDNTITPAKFSKMSNEDIIEELVQVKGIGRWTAEMFLMFSLARPDVFAYDDLGLRKNIYRFYFNGREVSKERVLALTRAWAPYRSVASWYLWAASDKLPKDESVW
jgi:DNA-3-methyladenine glycosylase II